MQLSSAFERSVDRLFEHSFVFNLNQILLDGGKKKPIRRFLDGVSYRSVVDVGCGPGNWAPLARGAYLGIDTSERYIAACRKRYRDDARKRFVRGDVTRVKLNDAFDLGIMISVLHHLSDEQAVQAVQRLSGHTTYLFVLDLYPNGRIPLSRWLYEMDRGSFVRTPALQKQLITNDTSYRLLKEDDFYSWNRLYRHTMFLFRSEE